MPTQVEWIIKGYFADATSASLRSAADPTSRSLLGESDMHAADACRLLVSNHVRLTPSCVVVLANQGMVE